MKLFFKLTEILILIVFAPIIIILNLFKRIKIGYIKSRHLGTYATPLEILNCEKKIIYNDENTLYIWFKDKVSDNIILFKKLTSKDFILPSIILKPIFKIFLIKLYFQKKYILFHSDILKEKINESDLWQTRDIHHVPSNLPSSLELNQNEMDVVGKIFNTEKN